MRAKKGINMAAATVPRQWGSERAAKLGFPRSEWISLWWFARYPEHVMTKSDEARRAALLGIISRDPEAASKLIQEIRNHEQGKKDDVVRNVILDLGANPPNWTLTDKEIAQKVCERQNRPNLDARSDTFKKLTANVKKQRQEIAKQFPLPKGKV